MTMHRQPGKSTAALIRAASCRTHPGAGLHSMPQRLSGILSCRSDRISLQTCATPVSDVQPGLQSLVSKKFGWAISCRWPYFAQWGAPTFSWGSTFAMLAGAISAMVESVSCPASS